MEELDFEQLKIDRENRRQWRLKVNWEVLNNSPIPFSTNNNGVTLLFRVKGKPHADFYPGTGRWRSDGKTFKGGAKEFLKWYNKQNKNE